MEEYEYDIVERFGSSEVDYYDFTDSTIWEDGRDNVAPNGTDWADVIFFMSHGCTDYGKGASAFLMGVNHGRDDYGENGGDTCFITTRGRYTDLWPFWANPCRASSSVIGSSRQQYPDIPWTWWGWGWMQNIHLYFLPHPGHISWGNTDANVAVNGSCYSCELSVWNNHGYKPGEFSKGQFNLYAGFHGEHNAYNRNAFNNFLNQSMETSIGRSWVYYMTQYMDFDTCAAVVTFGESYENRSDFFYNAKWKNILGFGTGVRGTGSTYWAVVGCRPTGSEMIECKDEGSTTDSLVDNNKINEQQYAEYYSDYSSIILEPDGSRSLESRDAGEFYDRDFLRIVKKITGSDVFRIAKTSPEMLKAENDSYVVQLYPEESRFNIRVKGNINIQEGEKVLENEVYLKKTYRMMNALGASPDEMRQVEKSIVAFNRDHALAKYKCIPQDKGYYISRFIGGIRVAGNSVSISFRLDGSLLNVSGRWDPINYFNSQLYSEITHSQLVDMAFELLESENADLDSDPEILLGTVYQPVQDDNCGWILDLKGTIMVRHKDADGRILRTENYEFDI